MIIIKGAKLVAPNSVRKADIAIEKGRIIKVARLISKKGARKIDASGLFALPGAIDAHVHFRDPEDTRKEDFSTGTASALAGGVTTIIDMPSYAKPPTVTIAAYRKKRKKVSKKARCDFQIRLGASETNAKQAAKSNSPSIKMFLIPPNEHFRCSARAIDEHFKRFPKNRPICIHAEDEKRILQRSKKYREDWKIKDKKAAQAATRFVLSKAKKFKRRVHLCHLTTALEVKMCRKYKKATYEINPAHLFLSLNDLHELGFLGTINPPIRCKKEQKELWKSIGNDTIIASDHAPHLVRQKRHGAPGFPGVGTLLPLMLHAAHKKRVSLQQVVRMCCENPAKAFNLKGKGSIRPGFDADIVLVDMNEEWKIKAKNRLSKCKWTPFEGKKIYGKIEKVFLRGKPAYDGKKVLSKKGEGKEVS